MLCEKCKKNIATVHYQKVVNGNKTEYHLCNDCAKQLNINTEINFNFNNMFEDFLGGFIGLGHDDWFSANQGGCNSCGNTLLDFKNSGKLGCADCYTTFEDQFDEILRNVQGNNRHIGKIPGRIRNYINQPVKEETEVDKLKSKLNELVKNEEYEQAAKIRDEIKKLEGR